MKIGAVGPAVAKNPYKPGVGTRLPFLAGRDGQLRRFARLVEDYPEKRNNLRMTGLRGVGPGADQLDVAMLPSAHRSTAIVLGRYMGEGFDDPRLDTLVLAMPIAWSGT